MTPKSFKELEHEGWQERASTYDRGASGLTGRAIGPILESFGDLAGKRLLDVAHGPGHLAGEAAKRGAAAEGLDFSSAMIAVAKENYPALTFTEGDAADPPFESGSFDAVACAFGLLHLENPDAAIAQVFRILKPGGRFAFTVWRSPEQGCNYFGLIIESIERYGKQITEPPSSPSMFRFADREECEKALTAAGFTDVATSTIDIAWRGESGEDVWKGVTRGSVRAKMLLEAQSPDTHERIREAIIEAAERHRVGDRLEIAMPAHLVTARKP